MRSAHTPQLTVHAITPDELRRADGDAFAAFSTKYVMPPERVLAEEPCPHCQSAWMVEERMAPEDVVLWAASDGAALLALDVLMCSSLVARETASVRCRIDAASRDASTLRTPHGDLQYRLIAIIYYDSAHYITVGRSSPKAVLATRRWVCWDEMDNEGVVEPCAPPTGEPGVRSASGLRLWRDAFEPAVLVYC